MSAAAVAPQAIEAEEYVLGALLLAGTSSAHDRAVEAVLEVLEPQHFFRESHGLIYGAVRTLVVSGQAFDALAVIRELERSGALEEAGGRTRVHELLTCATAVANAPHHAGLVREAWEKRELLRMLQHLASEARNGKTSGELLEISERSVIDVRSRIERGRTTVVPSFQAAQALEAKFRNPPEEGAGIPTPFPSFLRPLQPGRLYVLGGYTADGKTVIATQFARSAAEGGHRVGYVTIEMAWSDLSDRIVSAFGVPYWQVQSGRLTDAHRPAAERALRELARWQLDLIDDEGVDAAALWRYQRLGRYALLIVDHLHRIDWSERRDLEREVRAITNVARRENVPILLLAQLSRQGNDFPRPTLASFRETAVIEQEAWMAMAIWRKREKGRPTDDAELIVLKNRSGPDGWRPLQFRKEEARYVEVLAA